MKKALPILVVVGIVAGAYFLIRRNTPRNQVKFNRGLGTRDASLAMAALAHPCARGKDLR
jgi:hypothetical protein